MDNRFELFTTSVVMLNRYLQKVKDMEMRKFGLRASHTMCLYYLGQSEEGLTATELINLCREDKAAISRCLSQLLEKKLITCDDTGTKRSYRVKHYLTEEGQKLISEINHRISVIINDAGSGLTDEQRTIFYESMRVIGENLETYLDQTE